MALVRLQEDRQGWWIAHTRFPEGVGENFTVITKQGIDIGRRETLEAAQALLDDAKATGRCHVRHLRPHPPRRFSGMDVWVIAREVNRKGQRAWLVVSPEGVIFEEFEDRKDAEDYIKISAKS